MGKFNKNPLFVVQKDTVEEVENFFEYFFKKFGLEPVFHYFQQILQLLMDSVSDYSTFVAVKSWLDQFVQVMESFLGNFDDSLLGLIKHNLLRKV
ncbi:MAG: hypothetical protein ACO20H_11635 [Bacteriovoracaceae bacterium]